MLERLIEAQHGDPRVVRSPDLLPAAPVVRPFTVDADGARWVEAADARGIGDAALGLGAGRKTKTDDVDPAVGIMLRARIGDRVEPGQPLADVHARSDAAAEQAFAALRAAFRLSPAPVAPPDNAYETVG
jgi:thymidine phosphorylase